MLNLNNTEPHKKINELVILKMMLILENRFQEHQGANQVDSFWTEKLKDVIYFISYWFISIVYISSSIYLNW